VDSWLKVARSKCLFASLLFMFSMPGQADRLKPFTSDGCSSFPDGTIEQNTLWLACCEQHDFTYWKGGTYQQRLEADNALKSCVAEVGEPAIALLMLAGVRVGGSPFFPTKFRWGYGWSYPRFYGVLTEEELEQIQSVTSQTSENSQNVFD
jgi:hypothetical protein